MGNNKYSKEELKFRQSIYEDINNRLNNGEILDGKKHIFNNGQIEIIALLQPKGFVLGRLPFSQETREKQSNSAKKRGPNNKNKKFSEIACKNMSIAKRKFLQENPNWESATQWKSGNIPWNKGLTKESDERVAKSAEKYKISRPKGYHYDEKTKQQKLQKERETKLKNNSFNTSKIEHIIHNILLGMFGEEDVEHNYNKDLRYPWKCDFYIKSEDLFIEVNYSWMHGGHPFNPNNEEDLKILNIWKSKMKDHQQYKSAINCWTINDIEKINTAKKNKLKYIMIYNKEDLHDFIRSMEKRVSNN